MALSHVIVRYRKLLVKGDYNWSNRCLFDHFSSIFTLGLIVHTFAHCVFCDGNFADKPLMDVTSIFSETHFDNAINKFSYVMDFHYTIQ